MRTRYSRKKHKASSRSSPPLQHSNFFRSNLLKGFIILIAVVLAYIPALNAGFIWDDDAYVTQNPTLRSLEGLWRNWAGPTVHYQYYPLVLTTFWIQYQLWGLTAKYYHLVNILLHSLNAILLWILLRKLQIKPAWFAALIFALHPVHVESVAWITELKNVQSLFFYLLSALSYFHYLGIFSDSSFGNIRQKRASENVVPPGRKTPYYVLSLFFFICALLSKTVTSSLPAAILLILFWKRGRLTLRDFYPLLPFFCLGIIMGLFTVYVEKHEIKAQGEEWALNFLERVLIAGRALWFYASKLILPTNLIFFYPRWEISTRIWWQYLYPTASLFVLLTLWVLRSRLGRGPLVATLFFAGTLFPALGFFNIYPMRYSFVADHFQYHASIGLIVLIASLLYLAKAVVEKHLSYAGLVSGIILLSVLGVLTFKQGYMYKDIETLWRETIRRNPSAWMAYSNLAIVLELKGQLEDALALAQRALELKPDDPVVKHNVANMLWGNGRYEEAATLLREVLQVRPDLPHSHSLLGATLLRMGQYDEAEQALKRALQLDPLHLNAKKGMAHLMFELGRYEECLKYAQEVLEKQPDNAPFWFLTGEVLEALGRYAEARTAFTTVLQLQPDLQEAKKKLEYLP